MAAGITFTMAAHENVYLWIQTCYIRPHLRYRTLRDQYFTDDHAINT